MIDDETRYRKALEQIAELLMPVYRGTSEHPDEQARRAMRKAKDTLARCGEWLDQPEGELIPLNEMPDGPPIRRTIVVAGHVSPGEIPWCRVCEEFHFYPADFDVETIDEVAEILRSKAPPEGDYYTIRHTYAKGVAWNDRPDHLEFCADVAEEDGHPVTILEAP